MDRPAAWERWLFVVSFMVPTIVWFIFMVAMAMLYGCATGDPYTASNPRTFDKVYSTKPF